MARTLCGFCGDEIVDARAQVLQQKIVLDRGKSLVDFLGPRFQRNLDAEFLVQRENDIEEIQAVDAQVVDRVRIGFDLIQRNLARFSDHFGNNFKSRGHGA